MTNLIYVKFSATAKPYLFSVKSNIEINKGDVVFVENKKGNAIQVTCACNSFYLPDDALSIILNENNISNLMSVVGLSVPSYTMIMI